MPSIQTTVTCWRRFRWARGLMDYACIRSRGVIRSAIPVCFVKCCLAVACAFILSVPAQATAAKKKPANTVRIPPIDLNTASPKDLESLPGIGAATAKRIVAGRPYGSANDLARVGVSRRTITAITPMVTGNGVDSASTPARKVVPMPPVPGMVWANLDTKRYHQEGSRWFGATKNGKYMTEADAVRAGYKAAKE
jgi:hypothetical protein